MVPSGVLMIGLALVLRNLLQTRLGVRYGIAAILIGAANSSVLGPPRWLGLQRRPSCSPN